jgi:hypothetical protein
VDQARGTGEPDLSAWVAKSRLNLLRALPDRAAEPSVQTAGKRYLTHLSTAIERLSQLGGSASPDEREQSRTSAIKRRHIT